MHYRFFHIVIAAVLLFTACYKEGDYSKPFDPNDVKFNVSVHEILADGTSIAIVTVEIPEASGDTFSTVNFKTTAGLFTEVGEMFYTTRAKKIDEGQTRNATATLRSSLKTGMAILSVEFFDHKKTDTVFFTNACPDTLSLTASSFQVNPENGTAGEISITAQAKRLYGKVSTGNVIELSGYDSLYKFPLGSLRIKNDKTDDNGAASFTFVLGDSVANRMPHPYTGRFYIVGTAINQNAKLVHDTLQIISSK